jgi:cytochrome d ubiquinol oxidase subunit I
MEGVFSFFLESSFLGLFLFGEKSLGRIGHWFAAFLVFLGSWMSGYLIVVTDAWMQHPTGYEVGANGDPVLTSFWGLLLNPWGLWQYAHTMIAAVVTASFVMSGIGAYYLLMKTHEDYGRVFVRLGVIAGLVATILLMFPTGDSQGRNVARYQPATLAAMEGVFQSSPSAPLEILGQPNTETMRIDNPISIPRLLSFITYRRWIAEVKGLRDIPRDQWPDNISLLFFSFHIMVGLGTVLIAIMAVSAWLLRGGRIYRARPMLWILMLAIPFPYIATTAGWMAAEIGRQPWLIYGIMRTTEGTSPMVSAGNGLFTLLGFMGLYSVLSVLFLFLVTREIAHGPEKS